MAASSTNNLSDLPIRPAYEAALRATLAALGAAGTWWDGSTRVAIAEVARFALTDAEPLAPWEAPSAQPGRIEQMTKLPIPAVAADAAYRIARHPPTLTAGWYETITHRDSSFGDGHYVELVTVVVRVAAADRFCHAAGIPVLPLPAPEPGIPSEIRPAPARVDRHWVPTISPKDAGEEYGWLYPGKAAPNVVRALTLVPDAYAELMPFQAAGYVAREFLVNLGEEEGRPLTRGQIELVAASTSAANECFY